MVAQLWDAGDVSNLQLLLVRLCQQGELERQGWRREAGPEPSCRSPEQHPGVLRSCVCSCCSSPGAADESSLQLPNTCRTGLTAPSQGHTRTSQGAPLPQGLSFSSKGPTSKLGNIYPSVMPTSSFCSSNPKGGDCPLQLLPRPALVFWPLRFNTLLLILYVNSLC